MTNPDDRRAIPAGTARPVRRPWLRPRTASVAVVLGALLLAVAGVAAVAADRQSVGAPLNGRAESAAARTDPLATAIAAAERRLSDVPGDHPTWARLGAAYVEQARLTADPTYYAKADDALHESLRLRPAGNDVALAGLGALANARHDFAAAADFAQQALTINPYSATAWGVLTDARTQLGDYPGATAAVQRMLALRPGIASFTRASYDAELHGDLETARVALEQALDVAQSPAEKAFCRAYLGALAFSTGDLERAAGSYAAGLAESPGDPALLLGRARVSAARGEVDAAVADFRLVADGQPTPENVAEFGDYLSAVGRDAEAQQLFSQLDALLRQARASGANEDLTVALHEADHGDPSTALRAAEAEFGRRQNVEAHDALAWALHRAGRDAEALPHAQAATGIGGSNALFLYHRGVVEAALGMRQQARATLDEALDTNPWFSPLHAPDARALLDDLGGAP